MKGYIQNIEEATLKNEDFRQVLYTAKHSQLVVMNIPVGEEIGEEIHELDQFLRIEAGTGEAILDDVPTPIKDGSAIVVPAGTKHNVVNKGDVALKLYTVYSPPEHLDGTVHHTRADAMADTADHFDGKTSE